MCDGEPVTVDLKVRGATRNTDQNVEIRSRVGAMTYYAGKSSNFKHVEIRKISHSADPKVTPSSSRRHGELFVCCGREDSGASFDSSSGMVGCDVMEP